MPQNTLDTDGFTGTANTLLSTYNAKWTKLTFDNELVISTPNGGVAGTAGAILNTGSTWTNDHWAEVKVEHSNANVTKAGPIVRNATGNNLAGYFGGLDSPYSTTAYVLVRFDANTEGALLGGPTGTWTVGDTVNVEAVGNQITLRVNGSILIGPVTDSTYTTNNPGMLIDYSLDSTTKILSTWKAGSVGDSGGATRAFLRSGIPYMKLTNRGGW